MQQMSRILAATDGSESSEHAIGVAEVLAKTGPAQLEVLGVETASLPAVVGLDRRVRRWSGDRPVTWVSGIPGVEIVRRAERTHADLIVLGRRERSGAFMAPGRTTDTVVRRFARACLMVPPNVRSLDRMLVALDGTRRGLGVLSPAAAFAGLAEAKPQPLFVSNDGLRPVASGVARILTALVHHPELGGPDALRVLHGNPVREILDEVERSEADLLVIGVRRGGPAGEMGSGHVGQDLLREAPVAILTVPI